MQVSVVSVLFPRADVFQCAKKLPEDEEVRGADPKKKERGDRSADECPRFAEGGDVGESGRDGEDVRRREANDDRRMAERKKETDADGGPAAVKKASCRVVDGGDMVRIHRVSKPESPSERKESEEKRG